MPYVSFLLLWNLSAYQHFQFKKLLRHIYQWLLPAVYFSPSNSILKCWKNFFDIISWLSILSLILFFFYRWFASCVGIEPDIIDNRERGHHCSLKTRKYFQKQRQKCHSRYFLSHQQNVQIVFGTFFRNFFPRVYLRKRWSCFWWQLFMGVFVALQPTDVAPT